MIRLKELRVEMMAWPASRAQEALVTISANFFIVVLQRKSRQHDWRVLLTYRAINQNLHLVKSHRPTKPREEYQTLS